MACRRLCTLNIVASRNRHAAYIATIAFNHHANQRYASVACVLYHCYETQFCDTAPEIVVTQRLAHIQAYLTSHVRQTKHTVSYTHFIRRACVDGQGVGPFPETRLPDCACSIVDIAGVTSMLLEEQSHLLPIGHCAHSVLLQRHA